MTTQFTAIGDISYRGQGIVKKRLLKNGNYKLIAARFGQPFTIPKNSTVTAKWRRYDNFPQAIAPLSEGITPPGRKLSAQDITATMQQFGDWAQLTDVIWDTHEDAVPTEVVDKCGIQIGETLEVVTISTLKSDSNVFYANNAGSRGEINSPPLAGDLKRIERALAENKAEYMKKIIGATTHVSTEPIDEAYILMAHTNCLADFEALEGWIPFKNYSDMKRISPAEKGSVGTYRCLFTPLFTPWLASGANSTTYLSNGNIVSVAAASDVYPAIIVAEDAYGVVRLQGFDAVTPAVRKPTPQVGDELGQKGFVSWKTWYTAVVLNSNWLVRYEICVTSLP